MEKQEPQGSLVGAFAVGGLIAAAMQVVMVLLGTVLPDPLPTLGTLLVLGIFGMVMVLTGNYAKLNEVGGFGASIMFCGLVDAAAGIYAGTTLETGKSSEDTKSVVKFLTVVIAPLCIVGVALGFALAKAGNAGVLATVSDTTAAPGPISILYALLMGGAISIVGQALLQFTPLPMPAVILVEGACGMLSAVFGIFTKLEVLTGAGLVCTVVDAGGGMVSGGALLAVAGTPFKIVAILLMVVVVSVMGLICGKVLVSRAQRS